MNNKSPSSVSSLPALLIPACKPDHQVLCSLVQDLLRLDFPLILVVDDGSPEDFRPVFRELKTLPRVKVLRHAVNMGKGRALKTGINEYLNCLHEGEVAAPGLVTVDADGQHRPADILKVCQAFQQSPDALCLGVRNFSGSVPLRSRFGNSLTKRIFKFLLGREITDTQTGLRAIPNHYLPRLMSVRGGRYEFELEMLIDACSQRMPLVETPIETVYLEENQSSHFNPLLDSARIYFVFFRFSLVSFLSFLIDTLLFFATYYLTASVVASAVLARLCSGTFNFSLNKYVVFKSDRRQLYLEAVKYGLLVSAFSFISILLIDGLRKVGLNLFFSKMAAEAMLFLMSFSVQRLFVFVRHALPAETADRN